MRVFRPLAVVVLALASIACERELNPDTFKRAAEKAYIEVHPGWGIVRRDGMTTTFVRGDQIDTLDIGVLYDAYTASKMSGSDFLDDWMKRAEEQAKLRRRVLEEAKSIITPVLKSGSWIRVQDLGAIGPKHLQDRIRPWRREVATDVFVLIGIPEERLGFRFASIEEVKQSKETEQIWLDRAIANLRVETATSAASELRAADGHLLVHDLSGYESISGLILDPKFRGDMLEKFGKEELGASAPIRNVLIIFDPTDFTAVKPIRARTHQLYDTQNHPAFRGLLKFDKNGLSLYEAANPEAKAKP